MGRTKRKRSRRRVHSEISTDPKSVYGLLKWLHSLNLEVPHMKVVDTVHSGRGVRALAALKAGEDVISLPLEAMITTDVVRQSRIPDIFTYTYPPITGIVLWLVYEEHLGDSSKYAPYLKIIPKDFDCLFLSAPYEMDALPPWIKVKTNSKLKEIKTAFNEAHLNLDDRLCDHCQRQLKDIYSYDKFIWAWTSVNTRCVYYEDETTSEDGVKVASGSVALAPYLDFFNHSNRANVEAKLNRQRGVYTLITRDKYKKYDEIFIKYGAHSNLQLLVEYGFIECDEKQDIVQFTFDEALKAAQAVDYHYGDVSKLKYKFITYNNLHVNLFKSKDEFSWAILGLLYILVTEDDDLEKLLSKLYSSTFSDKENQLIAKIQKKMIESKDRELLADLAAMEKIRPCSRSFSLAKHLVQMYRRILNA